MTNSIVLLENESWKDWDASIQNHVELALKRVIGSKLEKCSTLAKAMDLAQRKDCVFAIPILTPGYEQNIAKTKEVLTRAMPLPNFLAVCFLLMGDENFREERLLGAHWVETIDSFYDNALPTQFVLLHGLSGTTQWFHISTAIASLQRDLDTLRELDRIASSVSELEHRLQELERHAP